MFFLPASALMFGILVFYITVSIVSVIGLILTYVMKRPEYRSTFLWIIIILIILGIFIFSLPCTGYKLIQFGNLTVSPERCAELL